MRPGFKFRLSFFPRSVTNRRLVSKAHAPPVLRTAHGIYRDVTKTGNGERGTGNRERESGYECTAVTRVKIEHGGQKKRKGNNLVKCEEVLRLLT